MMLVDWLQAIQTSSYLSYLLTAYGLARANPGVGKRGVWKLGAVVVGEGGRIVGVGRNSLKTHPRVLVYSKYPYLHAEMEAMIRARRRGKGGTLIVVRAGRGGRVGMGRPCRACQEMARDVGVRKMVWSSKWGVEERRL